MTRLIASLLALLAFLGVCSCGGGDTHEKVAKESLSVMQDLAQTLGKITDAKSAEANKSKLESLVEKMNDLEARGSALGTPTDKLVEDKELMEEFQAAQGKLFQEVMRLAALPEANAVIAPTMEKMGGR